MSQRPAVVSRVNETLLDLEWIRPTFDRIFSDPAALRLWFAGLITYSEALTLAGVYVPFTDIGGRCRVHNCLGGFSGLTGRATGAGDTSPRAATSAGAGRVRAMPDDPSSAVEPFTPQADAAALEDLRAR